MANTMRRVVAAGLCVSRQSRDGESRRKALTRSNGAFGLHIHFLRKETLRFHLGQTLESYLLSMDYFLSMHIEKGSTYARGLRNYNSICRAESRCVPRVVCFRRASVSVW